MPRFDCEDDTLLQEVIQSTIACLISGGFHTAYWTTYDQIDWANTTITDGVITAYAMNDGGLWYKVESDPKGATFNSEFTEENQFYTDQILMTFESLQNRQAVQSAIQTGCIVIHIFDNNCLEWVFGVSHINGAFQKPVKTLRVARHRMDGGQLATSLARNELDLVGESFFGPLSSTVGVDGLTVADGGGE